MTNTNNFLPHFSRLSFSISRVSLGIQRLLGKVRALYVHAKLNKKRYQFIFTNLVGGPAVLLIAA